MRAAKRPPILGSWSRVGMPKLSHSARRPFVCPRRLGLGHGEEQLRDTVGKPRLPHGVDGGDDLHQRLGRAARLRDHDETRALEVEAGKGKVERAGIEIVVEARARARLAAMLVVAGNAPAAKLRQRLAAEARPPGAEKDKRAGAMGEKLQRLSGRSDVVAPFRHPQQGKRGFGIGLAQSGELGLELGEICCERGLRRARRCRCRTQGNLPRIATASWASPLISLSGARRPSPGLP